MFEFEAFNYFGEIGDFNITKNACPRETGGPVIKTGPTSGKNRSRNKDGRWRKKRSDAGKSRK